MSLLEKSERGFCPQIEDFGLIIEVLDDYIDYLKVGR